MKRKLLYTALVLGVFAPPAMAETIPAQQLDSAVHSKELAIQSCMRGYNWAREDILYVQYRGIWKNGGTLQHGYYCFHRKKGWPNIDMGAANFGVWYGPACPDSTWALSADKKTCTRPDTEEYVNAGPASCQQKSQFVGNPINASVGNKVEQQIDLTIPGSPELTLVRTFNSRYLPATDMQFPWINNFQRYAVLDESNQTIRFYRDNGEIIQFQQGNNGWHAISQTTDRLSEQQDSSGQRTGWQYQITASGDIENYDAQGKLQTIVQRDGNELTMDYTDGTQRFYTGDPQVDAEMIRYNTPPLPAGLLLKVSNTLGKSLAFNYNEMSQIVYVEDQTQRRVSYEYDEKKRLNKVTYPDNTSRQYLYENASYPSALTGIINELGQRALTVSYDDKGRAISTEHAGGVNKYQVTYQTDGSAKVTDPLGTTRQYSFTSINGAVKTTGLSQPCPTGCGQSGKHTDYDTQGNPVRIVDWNGTVTEYTHDQTRGLELRRTEGLQDQGGSSIVQPETRTIVTSWHATFAEPLTISEYIGGVNASGQPTGALQKQTVYTYDNQGNPLTRIEKSGTDSRQWKFQYGSLGRIKSVMEPNGVSSLYAYYPDDDADPGRRGQLKQTANNAIHITQITAYTADGYPSRIVDPNGKVTELTYDTRGRVTSQQTGGQRIDYTYDAAGQLTQAQGNDGTRLEYGYDNAGRLIRVSDHKNNRIDYILDNLGNRISETTSGPGGGQLKQIERQYNPLNQLKQISGNE